MGLKITIGRTEDSLLVKQATEIAELKRGLNDILLVIVEAEKGKKHISIKNDNELVGFIIKKLQKGIETQS